RRRSGLRVHPESSLTVLHPDILLDPSQVLFRTCPGVSEVPCAKPVMVNLSVEPCCPLHLQVPPLMYRPEGGFSASDQLDSGAASDLYLSTAELQPTEILPLEFSDDCLDVVGDDPPCPPSPLLDSTPGPGGRSAAGPELTDGPPSGRAVLPRRDSSEMSGRQRPAPTTPRPCEMGRLHSRATGSPRGQGASQTDPQPRGTREQNGMREAAS
ncbi:uncharacterized protein LOC144490322, partial [Mustelus asterias]